MSGGTPQSSLPRGPLLGARGSGGQSAFRTPQWYDCALETVTSVTLLQISNLNRYKSVTHPLQPLQPLSINNLMQPTASQPQYFHPKTPN